MIRVLVLFACAMMACYSAASVAADGDEALFGFRWGMTVAEVRDAGIETSRTRSEGAFETYRATTAPKPLNDMSVYSLVFANGRLVKLAAFGGDISADPIGTSGKERFSALRQILTEKYGPPKIDTQTTGNRLFKERDEFYQCLAYPGCGMWVSSFQAEDKVIFVELTGLRRGVGLIKVTAEATPQFSEALKEHKSRTARKDRDAL